MRFAILNVVLWSRDESKSPRILNFAPGKLNIITGSSKTGKSAIIPIIDYCLGSGSCAIPVERIRDACSWFGVVIQLHDSQLLLARREPGGQKSTSEMFVSESKLIKIPSSIPGKNTTADAVKQMLDHRCGLTNLDFDAEGTGSGFKARPSFRDLMAFVFQPQNVVANPDVFFYKADTTEHREKLKTVFPYALGAVTPRVMAQQYELEGVRKELKRKQREYEMLRRSSDRWNEQLKGWIARALELGLLESPPGDEATREQLIAMLRHVVTSTVAPAITQETITRGADELVELQREETEYASQLGFLRRRYSEMTRLRHARGLYGNSLFIQRDRLALSAWLRDLGAKDQECPLCANAVSDRGVLDSFYNAFEEIENELSSSVGVPASFDREIAFVQGEIADAARKLANVTTRIKALQSQSNTAQKARFQQEEIARYRGRIEQAIDVYDAVGTGADLSQEIAELREREEVLARAVSEAGIRRRMEAALGKISMFAGRIIPSLDAERPDDPVRLSITDLTVVVKGVDREDYLWEIGSGANWLAYHVAVTLALQEYFCGVHQSPVPALIIYDQPSQVYFPRRLAPKRGGEIVEEKIDDEDAVAVRRIFATVDSVVRRTEGELQAIILDHADRGVWGTVNGIHLVEEWRGAKLIPSDWPA